MVMQNTKCHIMFIVLYHASINMLLYKEYPGALSPLCSVICLSNTFPLYKSLANVKAPFALIPNKDLYVLWLLYWLYVLYCYSLFPGLIYEIFWTVNNYCSSHKPYFKLMWHPCSTLHLWWPVDQMLSWVLAFADHCIHISFPLH